MKKSSISTADKLLCKALIDPCVMLLKNGSFMAGFRLLGSDLDAATPLQRQDVARVVSDLIRRYDEHYTLHVITHRIPFTNYPKGEFSEKVTMLMDAERQMFFETLGNNFETQLYCFLTYDPASLGDKAKRKKAKAKELVTDAKLNDFKIELENFAQALSLAFSVEPLRDSDFISVLDAILNGDTPKSAKLPESFIPIEIDNLLARDFNPGSPLIYDNRYLSVVTVDGLPDSTYAGMLSVMQSLPFEYTWSIRFKPKDRATAQKIITKNFNMYWQRRMPLMDQVLRVQSSRQNLDAIEKAGDAEQAQAELEAERWIFGNFTGVIIIRSDVNLSGEDARRKLRSQENQLVNELQKLSFKVRPEHMNAAEAFLGALPGHKNENVREPLISSMNAAHLMPLGAAWTGPEYDPCPMFNKAPCLFQTGSLGRNPFRLSLHVGDVGHTLVLGPTGSGKSTLLGLIVAQFDRYKDSQVFVFDKGRSMYPLISAMDNAQFYNLGSENSPALCPLASLEEPGDLEWAANFLETLVELNRGEINPERSKKIQMALKMMAESTTSGSERRLSAIAVDIQDQALKNALMPYTLDGVYQRYLDGTENTLRYSAVNAFELEELLNLDRKVYVPTLQYLFREIEKRLDGRPTLVVLDEAWIMFDTESFAKKIEEWLRVLRKANASVVLATQSLSDVLNRPIGQVVIDSCETKILLPNSQIRSAEMKKLYNEYLQLNETEIEILANARPKQHYYYTSRLGHRLFSLELGRGALDFIGSSSREDLKTIDALQQSHGKDWVIQWLKLKDPDAAKFWTDYLCKLPQFSGQNDTPPRPEFGSSVTALK